MANEGGRKFRRVVLKLSGEALREIGSPDNISPHIVESIALQIKACELGLISNSLLAPSAHEHKVPALSA